ncbi:MAG: DUF4386 domain-containing protein [Gemmatimonadales bacterium]
MYEHGGSAGWKRRNIAAEARAAGAFFLLTILLGGVGEFISGRLVVPGDAAATASNILTHAQLFRLGYASYLVEMACQIAMTAFFYDLLKPVSRSVSLLAAFLSLVGIAIKTVSRVFYLAPLSVLGGAGYLDVFTAEQLQALALLLLKVNAQGAGMALVFFGLYALLKGWLIIKSTFLPRVLGVLGMLSGACWLTFLMPPIAVRVYPYIVAVGLLGAAAQIIWLLVFGVDERRWKEQAGRAAASIWA